MITRTVTRSGLLNISRGIRGERLAGEVLLEVSKTGIRVTPYVGQTHDADNSYVGRFDQYNRIWLAVKLRKATEIIRTVEIEVSEEGDILIKPIKACAFCGTESNLRAIGHKYLCEDCSHAIKEV